MTTRHFWRETARNAQVKRVALIRAALTSGRDEALP